MKRLFQIALLASATVIGGATSARADSMTIGAPWEDPCATCQGSIYTLDIVGLAATDLNVLDNAFDTYVVKLTIDTSGYNGGGTRIDEVAVKVSSGADAATLTGAPGGVSYWNLLAGGISADGCSGSGSGFECSDWIVGSAAGAYVPNQNLLTWTFNIDIAGPLFNFTSIDPDLLPSIKVRYVDDNDTKVGALVSENVPEPATLALLGIGMSMAAIRRRRTAR
jgi:PEP-CTERM motif